DPAGHGKTDHYARLDREWFEDIGVCFGACDVLDNRVTPERARELVRATSCLFLMGGDTKRQFDFMQGYGLIEPIRQSRAAVLGLSAGAINMAALAFHEEVEAPYEGLALADISVTPHFNDSRDDPAMTARIRAFSQGHPIYAMCDGSAIFVRGGEIEMLGEIYKIDHGVIEGVSL
ncbi:MAG: Type 1 glutamine amidotransferase-like domain-containing protein, partial [Oscillospiraceae bacterium]|nr:Type 1 glutamine amidotransferase-like domain-containing protein [Oscillospiraceae bacterium]